MWYFFLLHPDSRLIFTTYFKNVVGYVVFLHRARVDSRFLLIYGAAFLFSNRSHGSVTILIVNDSRSQVFALEVSPKEPSH